jgi:hypothetical protein
MIPCTHIAKRLRLCRSHMCPCSLTGTTRQHNHSSRAYVQSRVCKPLAAPASRLPRLPPQGEAVADVAAIWGVRPSIALTLLMHYRWSKERLLSECGRGCCMLIPQRRFCPPPPVCLRTCQHAHPGPMHGRR